MKGAVMLSKIEMKYYKDITRIADSLGRIANAIEKEQKRDLIVAQSFEEEFKDDDAWNIGDRIKQRLDELNMSQRELAKACKITEASMSHYINGNRVPKGPMCVTIAEALGCSVEWLLGVGGKEDE